MSTKTLSKLQISKLSVAELIKHKQELNKRFYALKDEIQEFSDLFDFTKKTMKKKLDILQSYQNQLTEDIIYQEDTILH